MAERAEPRTKSAPARPWWRRRRFWQLVIAIEVAGALIVSYVAEARAEGVAVEHIAWYSESTA